jgi:type VI secretion system secreted protein VgrG
MAKSISQEGRSLRLKSKVAGDDLVARAFSGEEAMSRPFRFELDMVSLNAAIDGEKMIGSEAVITIAVPGGGERVIHGIFSRFAAGGRDADGLTSYRGELVPAFWFLLLSSENRIFQNLAVPEIVEQVLASPPNSPFKVTFRNDCKKQYPKREYCVRYDETHLDFVSRLLEEEGIFYFFEHSDSSHTMVIADDPGQVKPCPVQHELSMQKTGAGATSEGNSVFTFEREDLAVTGAHRALEWDPIADKLYSDAITTKGIGSREEYPSPASDQDRAYHYASLRAGAAESHRLRVGGTSNCPALQSGKSFDLADHFRRDANQSYQLTSVQHSARMPVSVRGGDDSDGFHYENSFTAIPAKLAFRPPRTTPKSVVHGSQTAKVVGKEGEEIWVDKYGRVKVSFYWDINGEKGDAASCWVRVSSAWAGHGFGWIQVPRVGEEVIVDFLEGDPDRPIITGRVYNGDNMPPWPLNANQTRAGLRTRSSKGGGEKTANELYFEDKKGEEQVFLHAEHDLITEVENDETRTVEHDRTTAIKNNDTRTVKEGNDSTIVEKGKQSIEIKMGDRSLILDQGNESVAIKLGNQDIQLDMGNQTITLKMGDQKTKANLGSITSEAMQKIELKVGQSSITIDQMGVQIKGMMVKVEGQMQTEVKGLMTTVSGDAMLTAKGGITMIN